DSIVQHFSHLITILSADAAYLPNEKSLKVTTLQQQLSALMGANAAVINAYTDVTNARIQRNKILYDEVTGLVSVASDVKAYIK
ncbi:MAG: hypothetical protein JWN76_1370, partial [Chitinophagaceae bacterium]|nr:hypothetical protein [Chitinophagaceae bacterium]